MGDDRDDLEPVRGRPQLLGEDLGALSVAELEARIADLKAEIARVEAELARKRAHQTEADAIFKGSS